MVGRNNFQWFWQSGISSIFWLGLWLGALLISLGLVVTPGAIAQPSLAAPPITVDISLGSPEGDLQFVPQHLEFQAGQRYQLVLKNPSPVKHYFTSKDFADALWTQKVEAGQVEIKGVIHELELKPGATATWVFVPLKPGTYDLRCTIPGHGEAGMVGTLTVL